MATLAHAWRMLKEAAILYKDAASFVGILLGSVSLGSAIKSLGALDLNFNLLVTAYIEVIRRPLTDIFMEWGWQIPESVTDIFILYVCLGATAVRALNKIYDPRRERVLKGWWGAIASRIPVSHRFPGRWLWPAVYWGVGIFAWPILILEYSFRYRNVWHRYMDWNGSPNTSARIGAFTSNARTVPELLKGGQVAGYNPRFDYDISTDTWFALKGSFPAIFGTALAFTALALAASTLASYLLALPASQ